MLVSAASFLLSRGECDSTIVQRLLRVSGAQQSNSDFNNNLKNKFQLFNKTEMTVQNKYLIFNKTESTIENEF